jgi:hypothetical protein
VAGLGVRHHHVHKPRDAPAGLKVLSGAEGIPHLIITAASDGTAHGESIPEVGVLPTAAGHVPAGTCQHGTLNLRERAGHGGVPLLRKVRRVRSNCLRRGRGVGSYCVLASDPGSTPAL